MKFGSLGSRFYFISSIQKLPIGCVVGLFGVYGFFFRNLPFQSKKVESDYSIRYLSSISSI